MKKYLVIYKPFLLFLATFFTTYIVLTLVYQYYLNSFAANEVDPITRAVAKNTMQISQFFGSNITIEEDSSVSFIRLIYNGEYIAHIIEGCNAINVIILFIAFVASFSGKLKPTLLFILGGSLLVYFLNIVRIAVLCVLLYHFPTWEHVLHGVLFPLFIYGVVFLLWVIWVFKFSSYAKKSTTS